MINHNIVTIAFVTYDLHLYYGFFESSYHIKISQIVALSLRPLGRTSSMNSTNVQYQKILQYYQAKLNTGFAIMFQKQIPALFAEFILDQMTSRLSEIQIDSPQINIIRFYPFLRQKLGLILLYTPWELEQSDPVTEEHLQMIYYNFSSKFIELWRQCSSSIKQVLHRFQKLDVKKSFVNRIMVLTLIKQLSNSCSQKVLQKIRYSSFKLIPRTDELQKFILQRFDVFEFSALNDTSYQRFKQQIYLRYTRQEAVVRLQFLFDKKYSLLKKEPCLKNGRLGLLVSDAQQGSDGTQNQTSYMLSGIPIPQELETQINKSKSQFVVLTNAKYLNQGWLRFTPEEALAFSDNSIDIDFKQSFVTSSSSFVTSAVTNVGSSLGYLIANMPNNPTKFLKDFLLACTISGSMAAIIKEIPLLGNLIVLGGLGYQALEILNNADIVTKKKIEKILGITLSMGVTISTSVYGAILGQALIPIPILGGFIGGMMGGIIGGLSTKVALSKFQEKKIVRMIELINESQQENGSWELPKLLQILQVKVSFFEKYQAPEISTVNLAIMFCYYILTIFQTQQDQEEIAKLNDKLQQKWYKKNANPEDKAKIQMQIDQISERTPDSILRAQIYLIINRLSLIDQMHILQKLISQFLGVI